jgi:hypothetical protein
VKKLSLVILVVALITSCGGNKKVVSSNKNNYIINKYANLLETSKSEISNIKLYSFIDNWYGTKYKYGGMSKSGVDCSGFCNVLYKEVYNKSIKRTTSDLYKDINKKSKRKLKEGDLVFFDIAKKKNSHVGVYLKNNRFVHASTSMGVLISSLDNPYYKKTYNKGGNL